MAENIQPPHRSNILGVTKDGTAIDPANLPLGLRLKRVEARRQQREREMALARITSSEPDSTVSTRQALRELTTYEKAVLEGGTRLPWEDKAPKATSAPRSTGRSHSRHHFRPIPIQAFENLPPLPSDESSTHASPTEGNGETTITVTDNPKLAGAHRDGYSEDKCRYVLIKHCSWVPRQFNYAEGLKRVYPILRDFLGDENLDLATGVLYEMIEVPVDFGWEEGGPFQRWKFDHLRRNKNLENSHVPGLGNIVIGSIIPTEHLRRYRQHSSAPATPSCSPIVGQTPVAQKSHSLPNLDDIVLTNSLKSQKPWQIDYSFFVSTPGQGTRVHRKPPSAADLHRMIWDADFETSGRMIEQKVILPQERVPRYPRESRVASQQFHPKFLDDIRGTVTRKITFPEIKMSTSLMDLKNIRKNHGQKRDEFSKLMNRNKNNGQSIRPRAECECDLPNGHASTSAKLYEMNQAVKSLPDPGSQEGHVFYANIINQSLPDGITVPTEAFAVRNDLVPKGTALSNAALVARRVRTTDDLVLDFSIRASLEAATYSCPYEYKGPFTNELFKDSGLDYKWSSSQPQSSRSMANGQHVVRPTTPMNVLHPREKQSGPDLAHTSKVLGDGSDRLTGVGLRNDSETPCSSGSSSKPSRGLHLNDGYVFMSTSPGPREVATGGQSRPEAQCSVPSPFAGSAKKSRMEKLIEVYDLLCSFMFKPTAT